MGYIKFILDPLMRLYIPVCPFVYPDNQLHIGLVSLKVIILKMSDFQGSILP